MERVRSHMLGLLAGHEGAAFYRVAERIRYATEMEDLWYLRQDLMAALSAVHGEATARHEVEPLNELFKGLLPASMTAGATRPSRPARPHRQQR
ncbi:hypothetical protein PGB34_00255 [Xenophilus arseniciresistens]|uniref:Uncharacterized protein n=1 Tax=Xenophilus arseniciresistens TaxID=1283306 RepID=A0AAE3N2Y6_9BURK|nr:hypothetical protein [Xenophilus arseniciresistens]MDA7414780.1 hypothetical protein [Xenophilus arseniciresistens]